METCIFCQIVAGHLPSRKVYEDEMVYAFEDIKPQAPTHVLIVPKRHVTDLKAAQEADAEVLSHSQLVAARIARERGLENGYRTIYNVGPDSGQTVFHLHLHLLGGRKLNLMMG